MRRGEGAEGLLDDLYPLNAVLAGRVLPEQNDMAATLHPARIAVDADARFQPRYAEAFHCIGSACEDTCCQGWSISIDETTYARYQSLPPEPASERILQHLVLVTEGQSNWSHARIALDAHAACPLLDADRLCSIQKHYGEEYLSKTCTQYPRARQSIDEAREETLLLSCPEAARLVLLHDQPLLEVGGEGGRYRSVAMLAASLSERATSLKAYFWTVRRLCLMLLTDRSYPVWQRLFLLGMFTMRLETLVAEQRFEQTPKVVQDYAALAENGSLRVAMDGMPAQPGLQLSLLLGLLGEGFQPARRSLRFQGYLQRFADGIGYVAGTAAESLLPAYLRAFAECYRPWAEQNPILLENYLTNAAMGSLFPFGLPGEMQGRRPRREHLRLSVRYGLIQGLLIGVAGDRSSHFSTADAVGLIQSFVKTFEHDTGSIDRMIDSLEDAGLNNPRGFAALVRPPAV